MATAPPVQQQFRSTNNPEDNQGPIQPGVTVPVEQGQGTNPPPEVMGPNYENMEKLKPKWVSAIRDLIMKYRMEGLVSRRQEIRRDRLARLYWQGLQYAWWDPGNFNWNLPFQSRFDDDTNIEQQPRYQFVTNYYKGFGLTFVSLLSQDVPTVRWYPKSATNVQDIYAAKAASDVCDLIERNNDPTQLLRDIGYYFWCDGKCAAYVRYIADGERFGYEQQPELEQAESTVGGDTYVCPNCGARVPADKGMFAGGMTCPECGEPLSQESLQPAPVVPVPKVKSIRKIPNGQEVITIVGGLELNTPVWCRDPNEFPYVQWQVEVHRSKLRAVYPHVADKIQAGEPQDAEDVYARVSRLASSQGLPQVHPADALYAVVTFTRTWLDPSAFMEIDDKELRKELMDEFGDTGAYVAFAGSTYCEARKESRRKHWAFKSAEPGDGSARPGVGDGMIQIQERYNTLSNIQAETYEYGIPAGYCDPETISAEAWQSQTSEPATKYPAVAKTGQPLSDSFFFEPAAQVSRDMVAHMQDLVGPVAQFVTGLFPAIYGAEVKGAAGETASGYAMARDQAMGRIGVVWRAVKELWAEMMFLGLQCFKENRAEDVPVPILGDDGEFDDKVIRLADLQGSLFAYPEPDETFPRLKSQQRNVIQHLMAMEDPLVLKILAEPANMGVIRSTLGLTDLVIPGEDSANKQMREIDQMLKSAPIQQPQMGPMGQPMLDAVGNPIPMDMPSVEVDPLLDDHAVEFEECKRWANSEEGQQAKSQNPPGFANVHAHAEQHFKFMQAQMMAEQAASGVKAAQGKTD